MSWGFLVGLLVVVGCGGEDEAGGCEFDAQCAQGRICEMGNCVTAAGGGSTGQSSASGLTASDTQATSASASSEDTQATMASSAVTDPSSGSTTAPDTSSSGGEPDPAAECVAAGGELLPHGACLIPCAYDDESPGNDLLMDCVPNGMECAWAWCEPAISCSTDVDCGEGWRCVNGSAGGGWCNVYCEADSDCPGENICYLENIGDIYEVLNFCTSPV